MSCYDRGNRYDTAFHQIHELAAEPYGGHRWYGIYRKDRPGMCIDTDYDFNAAIKKACSLDDLIQSGVTKQREDRQQQQWEEESKEKARRLEERHANAERRRSAGHLTHAEMEAAAFRSEMKKVRGQYLDRHDEAALARWGRSTLR